MGLEEARAHLEGFGRSSEIVVFPVSSATVDLAAQALQLETGRIAKTLAFGRDGRNHLILFAGDARVDNSKYKARFGMKATMLSAEETFALTGHRLGGVCPFGLRTSMEVWLDESLRRFDRVYPACGSSNSAIPCSLAELELWSGASGWVAVSRLPEPQTEEAPVGV